VSELVKSEKMLIARNEKSKSTDENWKLCNPELKLVKSKLELVLLGW
jgi:hypothetical protein